jgi:hypothetical protein
MRKRLLLLSVLLIATIHFSLAQEYRGADLINSVPLGFVEEAPLFDFAEYNDTLYIPSWVSSRMVKFAISSKEMVQGYPINLDNAIGVHGLHVDENAIWAFDLDGSQINKYASDDTYIESIAIGSQPVTGIGVNNDLYIIDREENKIYIMDKSTHAIESSFVIDSMGDGGNKSDIFYYNDILYMVSDEFNGVLTMNLDGTNQQMIDAQSYQGIFIQGDTLYLGGGSGIDIINMDGELLNHIDVASDGFESGIVDLHIKNDTLYAITYSDNVMLVYELPSNKAELLNFSVSGAINVDYINVGFATRIEVAVPEGTNISNLTPTFTLSEDATAYNGQTMEEEVSGVNSHDFSFLPVSYIIEAEDGTQYTYAVFVYEDGVEYEKEIISFNIPGQISNEINQEDSTITITVPQDTDLTNLVANFELTYASVLTRITNPETYEMEVQISGETANDYSEPLKLTVFNHLMNDLKDYEITVSTTNNVNSVMSKSFSVYPNPMNEIANISLSNGKIQEITICDMTGKVLISEKYNSSKKQINISNLMNGMYTIKIQSESKIYTTKVLKR